MSNAIRDDNRVSTMLGVSSLDLTTPTQIFANPTTHAMFIDGASLYSAIQTKIYVTVGATNADYLTNGTNDTTQIQAAIDYVDGLGGGTVYIKEGTYSVTSALGGITVDHYQYIHIKGAGRDQTILRADAQVQVITLGSGNASGTTVWKGNKVSDLTIDMNNQVGATYGIALGCNQDTTLDSVHIKNQKNGAKSMLFWGVSSGASSALLPRNLTVNNCVFSDSDAAWEGITLAQGLNAKFINCTFRDKSGFYMFLNYGTLDVGLANCEFINTGNGVNGHGSTTFTGCNFTASQITVQADNTLFANCTWGALDYNRGNGVRFVGYQVTNSEAFWNELPDGTSIILKNNSFSNCKFTNANTTAINAAPFTDTNGTHVSCDTLAIDNCSFETTYWQGIDVKANYLSLSNNKFYNSGQLGTASVKYNLVFGATYAIISNNHSYDNQGIATVTHDFFVDNQYSATALPTMDISFADNDFLVGSNPIYYTGSAFTSVQPGNITVHGQNNTGLTIGTGTIPIVATYSAADFAEDITLTGGGSGIRLTQNTSVPAVNRPAIIAQTNQARTNSGTELIRLLETGTGSTQNLAFYTNKGTGAALKLEGLGTGKGLDLLQTPTNANQSAAALDINAVPVVSDGNTYTHSGSVLSVASNVTLTSGIITDTANLLSLTQSNTLATGHVLRIANSGNSEAIDISASGTTGGGSNSLGLFGTTTTATTGAFINTFWNSASFVGITGYGLANFRQVNASASGNVLVSENAGSGKALFVTQTGSSGIATYIKNAGSGNSLQIEGTTSQDLVVTKAGAIGVSIASPTAALHLPAGTATASTAPLKLTAGTNLTSAEAGAVEWDGINLFISQTSGPTRKTIAYTSDISTQAGKITTYNNVATAGWGIPAIYGQGRSTAQTAAVTSVATYTVGAADGSFIISANCNITAFTAGTFNVTVTYTDETNTSQTLKLNFSSVTGTLGIALAAAGPFEGIPAHIRCKASTAITIATSGTFTLLTYNVEGYITQIG